MKYTYILCIMLVFTGAVTAQQRVTRNYSKTSGKAKKENASYLDLGWIQSRFISPSSRIKFLLESYCIYIWGGLLRACHLPKKKRCYLFPNTLVDK